MSTNWIRIVPTDPGHVPPSDRARAVVATLTAMMPSASAIGINETDEVAFVDGGSNWESARCPRCSAGLDDGWWGEAMTDSYERTAFVDRIVVVPCCRSRVDLNQLDYGDWPVAFGRWWVDCTNPNVGRLDDRRVREIAAALGHAVTVVYRHM